MSSLSSLPFHQQSAASQVCLVLAAGAVSWYLGRRLLRPKFSPMEGGKKDNLHNSTATSRDIFAELTGRDNAVTNSSSLPSKTRSLASAPCAPSELGRQSFVARQVFNTPELLGMIMAALPLNKDRNVSRACKLFWQCTNPRASQHLSGIKYALGLKHSQAIKSMDGLSAHQLRELSKGATYFGTTTPPHVDWLLNIGFLNSHPNSPLPSPFLEMGTFILSSIKGSPKDGIFKVNLTLYSGDVRDALWMKGVSTVKHNIHTLYGNRTGKGVRQSWKDIKFLKFPFKLRVIVRVDFRKAMGASPRHVIGHCPIPGCQVGLYGTQHTLRDFELEEATLGEFFAFLDRVEWDVGIMQRTIADVIAKNDMGPHREGYYLGAPSVPPPIIKAEYGREYIPVERLYLSEKKQSSDSNYIF